jgi:hypothetical protein
MQAEPRHPGEGRDLETSSHPYLHEMPALAGMTIEVQE